MIDANERAFPVSASYSDDNPHVLIPTGGLTIRQEFAKAAMQGLISNAKAGDLVENNGLSGTQAIIAQASVELADALIEALNKNQTT